MFNQIGSSFEKLYKKKVVNFFLAERYCQKCAKEAWENEDNDQMLRILPGVCDKCGRMGIVAYIDNES